MKLGIIGLPSAGKTTVFNALTRGDTATGRSMGGRFDVQTAVVEVPDERADVLRDMFDPPKVTHARVTYTDIAGLQRGMGESGGMSGPLLNHLAASDGFVHVVRAFEDSNVPHLEGNVDPIRDLMIIDSELMLNDLIIVEGKLGRLKEGLGKGAYENKAAAEAEMALFEKLHAALSEERPLRELELDDQLLKLLRGYGLLTTKPMLIVINLGDDQDEIALENRGRLCRTVNLRGKLEMELAQLTGDDLALFMAEYGISELGLDTVIHVSYEFMGLQSFFTINEDELRAWTIQRGATAVQAAGAIHSDLAKGFIRAEVINYSELVEVGGMTEARAAGKLRQEGKTYLVQDGDLVYVKFNL